MKIGELVDHIVQEYTLSSVFGEYLNQKNSTKDVESIHMESTSGKIVY